MGSGPLPAAWHGVGPGQQDSETLVSSGLSLDGGTGLAVCLQGHSAGSLLS